MTDIPIPVAISAVALLYAIWWTFRDYVKKYSLDSLPGPSPTSFILGNFPELSQRQSWKYWIHAAATYGPVFKITGVLRKRLVVVHDPKALHTVLIKDQEFFKKSVAPTDPFSMLLGPGLLSTQGEQHRKQRKQLNPSFSVGHLRDMSHIFYRIARQVRKAIQSRVSADGKAEVVDVNGWMARTTLEMLGQAGLGYSFDNFFDDSTDSYGESLKLFFPTMSRTRLFGIILQGLSYVLPEVLLKILFRVYPQRETRDLFKISEIMRQRSQEIVDEKKIALHKGDHALAQEVGEGKDIMSICLRANMAASQAEKLTDEEIIAQMSTFILAGMDTTSNALSRVLHILAENPSVQEKLRAEIVESRGGPDGDLDVPYDDVMKLPFLDAVCRETLRVHAPVILSGRTASKDMVLPLSAPVRGRDGSTITEVFIPKGTVVLVHYQASNTFGELWGEDATEWKPERWLAPLPAALEDARVPGVFSNLMSFSGGARSCIGVKFSQLEMKVVLSVLLPAFSFELTGKPIAWNSSAVSYPTMGEESTRPEMLLKVRALSGYH